ncbi:DUF4260 family protein [Sphaerisporangium perillae]|uniref:DUF4260 family protein n=1 Tax=Sphaerisporangium perillae TaxID=2935860 RepID=UPI00200FDC87|nr:DUF4260 family protein [Sphaerisporangium perillae]
MHQPATLATRTSGATSAAPTARTPAARTPAARTSAARTLRIARRVGWLGLALFLTAFAVLEIAKYGTTTLLAAVLFMIAPDLTMLVGASDAKNLRRGRLSPRAVPFYNAAHRPWIPLALLVAYTFSPIAWPPLFAAGLAWLGHIAYDRALGYGLRTPEGFQRG